MGISEVKSQLLNPPPPRKTGLGQTSVPINCDSAFMPREKTNPSPCDSAFTENLDRSQSLTATRPSRPNQKMTNSTLLNLIFDISPRVYCHSQRVKKQTPTVILTTYHCASGAIKFRGGHSIGRGILQLLPHFEEYFGVEMECLHSFMFKPSRIHMRCSGQNICSEC